MHVAQLKQALAAILFIVDCLQITPPGGADAQRAGPAVKCCKRAVCGQYSRRGRCKAFNQHIYQGWQLVDSAHRRIALLAAQHHQWVIWAIH